MSILSTLLGKVFSHSSAAATPSQPASAAPAPATDSGPQIGGTASTTATPAGSNAPTSTSVAGNAPAAAPAAPAQSVDVSAILDGLQSKSAQDLNWKTSIVDMMGLLGMDNSLTARKHLATELGYTGDESDSATMNIWLHKEVMKKLAENGGKVPTDMVA